MAKPFSHPKIKNFFKILFFGRKCGDLWVRKNGTYYLISDYSNRF